MSYTDAIILGVVQGLTEFLPISSSGHLVLAQGLLGVKQPGVTFEIALHLGTLLSVMIYFRVWLMTLAKSLYSREMKCERAMVGYLIIGSVPAMLAGYFFEDVLGRTFSDPILAATLLLATGAIILIPKLFRRKVTEFCMRSALMMGIGQALAILPGISRSGSTIAFGIISGAKASRAAEVSFLLLLTAVLGAVWLKSSELLQVQPVLIGQYLIGAFLAFLFGLAAVYLVLSVIKRGKYEYFAYYCFAAGLVGLYLFS